MPHSECVLPCLRSAGEAGLELVGLVAGGEDRFRS